MLDEKDKHEAAGTLTYNNEWHAFELAGYELQSGESVEVSVFGYWIPGQITLDAAGWYLFMLDHVSIRLQSGLPARLCESSGGALPPLVHASQIHPLCWLPGPSVQKSEVFCRMSLLYYSTSLWQIMLFDYLNSMRSILQSKGQLNSITRRVFRRHCGSKAEFKGRSLSAELSTLRQNVIPQGGTT
jgi:hypothetical protein